MCMAKAAKALVMIINIINNLSTYQQDHHVELLELLRSRGTE